MTSRFSTSFIIDYDGLDMLYDYLSATNSDIPSDVLSGLIKSLSPTTIKFLNTLIGTPVTDAANMIDVSGNVHNGTFKGTWAANQRLAKGYGFVINPNGTDNYINLGDSNDFSFGDGLNDVAFTMVGIIEITNTSVPYTVIVAKRDDTTGAELREWTFQITADEKLDISLFDESTNVSVSRLTESALSIGFHTYVVTYSGVGGATAANGIILYVDGALVASTATNDASYVAMENSATVVTIGAMKEASAFGRFLPSDFTPPIIDKGTVWTAAQVATFHKFMKDIYGL